MKAFNLFLRLAKENKAGIIINVLITVLMIVLFYFVPQQNQTAFETEKIKVSYHIEQEQPLTDGLKSYLKKFVIEEKIKKEELEDAHYFQVVSLSIIIDGDLNEAIKSNNVHIELFSRNADVFINAPIEIEIKTYLSLYETLINNGKTDAEALILTNQTLESSHVNTHLQTKQTTNLVVFRMVSYLSYLIILTGLMIVVPVMINMRKEALLERSMISAYPKKKYTAGLFLGAILFILSFTALVFMLIVFLHIKTLSLHEILLYGLNTLMYTLPIIALSVFTGVLVKNSVMTSIIANVFGLSQSFIVGVFIPRSFLDSQILSIGRFLPGYYFVNANELIKDGVATPQALMREYAYLLGFTVVIVLVLLITQFVKRKRS